MNQKVYRPVEITVGQPDDAYSGPKMTVMDKQLASAKDNDSNGKQTVDVTDPRP